MFEHARDGSVAVSLVRRAIDRLKTAAGRSGVFDRLPSKGGQRTGGTAAVSETAESPGGDTSEQPRGGFQTVVGRSMIGRRLAGLESRTRASRLTAAVDRARVTGRTRSLRRYITGSVVYRWLTSEPEPDVIVIDLRETRTAGPMLSVLDRVITTAVASLPTSSVGAVGQALTTRVRARPIRTLSLLFLPVVVLSTLGTAVTGALTPALAVAHLLFSVSGLLGMRSRRSLEELLETRTVRVVAAAFEPPAPPEQADGVDRRSRTHTDGDDEGSTESAASSSESPTRAE